MTPLVLLLFPAIVFSAWSNYGANPQHTGINPSATPAQSYQKILWSTPVDLQQKFTSGPLFIHYGSVVGMWCHFGKIRNMHRSASTN